MIKEIKKCERIGHDWDNYGKCCNCGKWDIEGKRHESPDEYNNRRQREIFGFSEDDLKKEEAQKYNFWRGFQACLILVVAPVIIIIIVLAQLWVNANS